uniref:Uncharacterized protein n=1 Tax=Candidatus Methanophaga sp. ANME-1 ERB7 TaxID=2759913 RepID=A0A7G9ZCU7_9EURY|nr:hypothetical protein OJKMNAAM_00002 [Methanosarcinales archaeon ANME-1 ERB7]
MAVKREMKLLSCLVVIAVLMSTVMAFSAEPASTASVYVTSFTADDDLNTKITNVDASKFQAYFAYKSRTSMSPLVNTLVETGNTHSINSIFLMALAAWESGWGTSNYANTRCNYFGYGAVYSNPDKAWEFNSANECVDVVSRFIKCDYLLNSGTYSVLWPAGQIYNPSTKQDHKAPPYIEQTRNAGKYSNGPTLRGWIIKYNMNSQSEMNGILSIMNDFVSWHVKTYGVGLEVYSGENEQIVIAPSLSEKAASLVEEVVGSSYLWGGKGWNWKEGKFVDSNLIKEGYYWNWKDHNEVGKGVDCSGLVFWAYNKAAGATKYKKSSNPIQEEGASGQWKTDTDRVSRGDLNRGDLLFLIKSGRASHVIMYVGDGCVIHAEGVEFKKVVKEKLITVEERYNKLGYVIEYGRVKAASTGPSQGGTPYVSISKTIRSDSDNIIDLTTSNPNDGSRDVLFRITLTNMGTADARVSTADDLANEGYYSADPLNPPTRTDVTVPAGDSYSWEYRARYQGSATADRTPITNTARITWIHNYYNEVTGDDYGGHGALTSSQTAYIHNPSQPSQGVSADLNCDGKVDRSDSGILMSYWGTDGSGATSCRSPDINQDGIVNSLDLNILKSQWTQPNETPVARITMTSGSEVAYEDEVLELTVPSGGTATVHFSASRSSDPEGTISSYQWLINGQPAGDTCDFDSDNLNEGTYDIFLTVIDNERAEDSVGASIIITPGITAENDPPTAGLSMTSGSETAYEDDMLELTVPSGGTATVHFSASRSSDQDGLISSYQWFVNGQSASNLRDFDSNLGEGTHQIYLTVTDNGGAEDSVGASIIITTAAAEENEPPTARITMTSGSETAYEDEVLELTVPSGGTAKVDFSASRSTDSDGSISSYKWYISGSHVSSSRDFSYNLGEGTHQIYLTVKDNKNVEGSVGASVRITATNNLPTARISLKSGSRTAYENQVLELTVSSGGTAKVDFSASRSTDSDGSISSYKWYISGSHVSSSRDFSYNLGEGTHQIYLTVKDNKNVEGSVGASVRITATNNLPTARISLKSGSRTAYENQVLELTVSSGGTAKVDFSASRSTDSDGSISSYKWYISGSHVSSSRDFSYNLGEGTHQIYLTVKDNKNAEGAVGASVRITATNNPPTARISMKSGTKTAYENQILELTVSSGGTAKVDFSASRSTDSDGSISSYKWYISGSHVSSSQDFSYNLGEGTHQIYLTVKDNKNAEGAVGASVRITATNNLPTARISLKSGSRTAYENQVLELTVSSGGTAKVDFSASRSTDSDGSISSYKWYISGSHVSSSRDFSYNLGEGTHQIYLTVKDNKNAEGAVGASVRITATNNLPTARISLKSGIKTAYENQILELTVSSGGAAKVDFSASRSTDSDGSISSYKWYIGGSHVSSSRDFSYNLGEGTHQIYLTVKDNKNAEGAVGASVRITC